MGPGKGWWQIDLHTWRNNKKVRKICHYKKDNILNWVSKVIRGSFGFALFRYVIGPEKLFHFFYQSDSRTKTNHDLVARVFPRFRQFDCFYFVFSLALKVFFFWLTVNIILDLVIETHREKHSNNCDNWCTCKCHAVNILERIDSSVSTNKC